MGSSVVIWSYSMARPLFQSCYFFGRLNSLPWFDALGRTLRFNHEKSVVIVGAVGVHRNWRVGTFGLQYDLVAN